MLKVFFSYGLLEIFDGIAQDSDADCEDSGQQNCRISDITLNPVRSRYVVILNVYNYVLY